MQDIYDIETNFQIVIDSCFIIISVSRIGSGDSWKINDICPVSVFFLLKIMSQLLNAIVY